MNVYECSCWSWLSLPMLLGLGSSILGHPGSLPRGLHLPRRPEASWEWTHLPSDWRARMGPAAPHWPTPWLRMAQSHSSWVDNIKLEGRGHRNKEMRKIWDTLFSVFSRLSLATLPDNFISNYLEKFKGMVVKYSQQVVKLKSNVLTLTGFSKNLNKVYRKVLFEYLSF